MDVSGSLPATWMRAILAGMTNPVLSSRKASVSGRNHFSGEAITNLDELALELEKPRR
jgi:hypothetical protein